MNNISVFEKAVKVVDKYGAWKVFQTIIYVGLFVSIFYLPTVIKLTIEKVTLESIETADRNKEEIHIKNLERRKDMQPQIYAALSSTINKINADRAFIIELHNGSNNLNGVPFLHGSVTYEKSREGLDNIDEEYQNLSLSRYDFATYLHTRYSFIGSIEELSKIDKKLATKLVADDAKYIAIVTLHNGTNEWGWFGIIFNRDNNLPSDNEIMNEMLINSQTISKILNVFK